MNPYVFSFLLTISCVGCGTTRYYGLAEGTPRTDAAEVIPAPFVGIRQVNGKQFNLEPDWVTGGQSRVLFAPGSYDLSLFWRDTNYYTAETGIVVRKGYTVVVCHGGTLTPHSASDSTNQTGVSGGCSPLVGEPMKHLLATFEKGRTYQIVLDIADKHATWFDPPYRSVAQ